MTSRQRHALLLHWWPAACAAQGWDPRDRPLRLRVLNLALNQKFHNVQEIRAALELSATLGVGTARPHIHLPTPGATTFHHQPPPNLSPTIPPKISTGRAELPFRPDSNHPPDGNREQRSASSPPRAIQSARELDHGRDIDAVKSLLKMLTDDLPATLEQGRPQPGQDRRTAQQICAHLRCLALYPLENPMGKTGATAYLIKIARQKIPALRPLPSDAIQTLLTTVPALPLAPGTIPPIFTSRHREQILYTLSARLNGQTGYRHTAGHSLHTMKTLANLSCPCAHCRP